MKKSLRTHTTWVVVVGSLLVIFLNRITAEVFFPTYLNQYFADNLRMSLHREIANPKFNGKAQDLHENMMRSLSDLGPNEVFVSIDGAISGKALGRVPSFASSRQLEGDTQQTEVESQGVEWLVFQTATTHGEVQFGIQLNAIERNARRVFSARVKMLEFQLPMIIVLVVGLAYFMSWFMLRPLKELQEHIRVNISHSDVQVIDDQSHYKEFSEFIRYFNELIEKLQKSRDQASRFSSDAAHELRTPLTVIRGYVDQLINKLPDSSENQAQVALIANEVERLISISDKLLKLSQADAGSIALDMQETNISELLAELLDDVTWTDGSLRLITDIAPNLIAKCDGTLVWQLVNNLINNAIKFNMPNGLLEVKADRKGDAVFFSITNTTFSSIDNMEANAFKRFFREVHSHEFLGKKIPGAGLGLSLCYEIVKAHKGHIQLTTAEPNLVKVGVLLPIHEVALSK